MESESSRYAIDLQGGTNWFVIPSDENLREAVRYAQRSKYSTTKTCLICKQPFDYGYVSLKTCCACELIAKCAVCGTFQPLIQYYLFKNREKDWIKNIMGSAYELNSMLEDLTGEKVETVKEMDDK